MSFCQSLLRLLDTKMEVPGLYGWVHILALVLTALLTVWMWMRYRVESRENIRRMVRNVAILVIALEVYKQVNYSFGYEDGISFYYQWYAFPFQFCSTPMYLGLLAGLTRKGKIHDAANAYLASYALFAGACVMVYPAAVFTDIVGINIQTMICHGSMIVVGVCLLATGYVKPDFRTFRSAAAVFGCCIGVAMVLNEIAYRIGMLEEHDFNMFLISPYLVSTLPIYSWVQQVLPYPVCIVIYATAFSLAAYLIMLAAKGIRNLSDARKSKITA